MYEIWLILNTFYELALMHLGAVVGVLVVWLVLMAVTGLKKKQPWSKGLLPALIVAVPTWILCFVMIPGWTKSSFDHVNGVLDVLTVAGVAAALAGLLAVFVWPVYLLLRR